MFGKARTRTMPLVPEPFENHSIARQGVAFGTERMAQTWCKFFPNFDSPEYRKDLSEEKKTELDKRASRLFKRSIRNQLHEASEFGWEVCTWHDVFDLMMDDERLRIDKRPYEFLEDNDSGENMVKIRIPDATIGLRSYDDYDLKRGYLCDMEGCEEDHSTMQPDKNLSQDALLSMMHDHQCGLIVDGVWGKTNLIFPFAAYEAKKRARSYEAAEEQIYHACRTYLAMLDDLARNPDDIDKYQTEDSNRYQFFAFTSCGSYWQIFVAWNLVGRCIVETIWDGDVKSFTIAYDLICIVDQIHEYGVKHHRPFVIKHLEAWHTRHHRLIASNKGPIDSPSAQEPEAMDLDDSNLEDGGSNVLQTAINEACGGLTSEQAEWNRLKQRSKVIKDTKIKDSRKKKKRERRMEADAYVPAAGSQGEETTNPSGSTLQPTVTPSSEIPITKAKAKRWLESME